MDVKNLPAGFSVAGPIMIQAGHEEARVPLAAAKDAKAAAAGRLGQGEDRGPSPSGRPPGRARSEQAAGDQADARRSSGRAPGAGRAGNCARAPRSRPNCGSSGNGFADRLQFDVFNLPHGVIVDNIGLSGILIPAEQSEREIFLTADAWVPPVERPCFAETKNAGSAKGGNQDSPALLLRVRPAAETSSRTAGK